jgi:hypothetical protein
MWTLKENEVAYPWDDEIMAEVRQRKAELVESYGTVDALHKHFAEERIIMEKEGFKFADPDEVRERNFRRQMGESR